MALPRADQNDFKKEKLLIDAINTVVNTENEAVIEAFWKRERKKYSLYAVLDVKSARADYICSALDILKDN